MIDQIQFRIVGNPSPHSTATDFPGFRRPRGHAQILAAILGIKRLKIRADQNLVIWTRGVSAPDQLSTFCIKCGHPTTDPELSAAVSDQYFVLYQKRRHGHALAFVNIAELRLPNFFPAGCIDGNRVVIQCVVINFPEPVYRASIHPIATGDPLRRRYWLWFVGPFQRSPWLSEIKRVKNVWPGRHQI